MGWYWNVHTRDHEQQTQRLVPLDGTRRQHLIFWVNSRRKMGDRQESWTEHNLPMHLSPGKWELWISPWLHSWLPLWKLKTTDHWKQKANVVKRAGVSTPSLAKGCEKAEITKKEKLNLCRVPPWILTPSSSSALFSFLNKISWAYVIGIY